MKKEVRKTLKVGKPVDNKTKTMVIGGAGTPIKKGDIKRMNH
ncbi:MAG: hypothetical protein AAF039_15415 [Bacteroidota bacterium]